MIDERFLMHRLRSSSVAGMVGGAAAGGLFLYRMFVNQVKDWDVFAILATIAVVKIALMIYFRLRG